MGKSKLLEKTEREPVIREIVVLAERHEEFLQDLIDEVQKRTNMRLNKSTVVRTLIETVSKMGLESEDITNVYRARRGQMDLARAHGSIVAEIEAIEGDLQLALIDEPTETVIIRQYRKNLRYQRERLKAVEQALSAKELAALPTVAPPEGPAQDPG